MEARPQPWFVASMDVNPKNFKKLPIKIQGETSLEKTIFEEAEKNDISLEKSFQNMINRLDKTPKK